MKTRVWHWLFLVSIGVCGPVSAEARMLQGSSPERHPSITEDQIFDSVRQAPAALLRQLYEEHQVLVLSFREHANERHFRALNTLLDQIGHDPRLKYIVLERFVDDASILEAGSVGDIEEMQLKQQLDKRLCSQGEWAYTWAKFMPRIRATNAARPIGRKLLVTTVDGLQMAKPNVIEDYSRDSTTAALFHDKIWRELQRDTTAKAIVVYNIAHTILGFTAARAGRTIAPNFLSTFLADHPDARTRTASVMIDGVVRATGLEAQFNFTNRHRERLMDQPFGVRMAPFRVVADERGHAALTAEAWTPSNALSLFGGVPVESTAILPEMVDAIVWLAESEQPRIEAAEAYFPNVCAD